MQYSIIQKSQLEGALRLDAEYYQPEYLELVDNLKKLGAVPIKEVAINPKRKFKPKKGELFQYIEISEVDLSTGEYNKAEILGENAPDRAQWIVKHDDVIISTVRPIRNAVSLIREDTKNLVCSSGFTVLKSEKIEPEYLFTYLKSKPIVELLDRKTTATMYPAITTEDILETKIYLGDKKLRDGIKNNIIEVQKKLENSKSFYSQAENLLLEELGLNDFKVEDDLPYIVTLSKIKSAHRVDAEYFQPKYEKIMAKIRKQNVKSIGQLSALVGHPTQSPYDETGDIAVLAQKHMKRNLAIDTSAFDNYTTENLIKKSDKKFILKKNDLLISSAGEPGLTCVWTEEGKAISGSFVTIVRFAGEVEPFYVGVFLNTIAGRLQFERDYTGSIQQYVYPAKIKEITIPILPKSTQQKITDLVQKSHEARRKAKELLEEAKQKFEPSFVLLRRSNPSLLRSYGIA